MEFRKVVDIPHSNLDINHQSKLMIFGSCFAENTGKLLIDNRFRAEVNPFGVLFNPASICQAINILLDEVEFNESDIINYEDTFLSFLHHSAFSDTNKNVFLDRINTKRIEATKSLKESDIYFITFGTSYIYSRKDNNQIVANCHKFPASYFNRRRLDTDEIVSSWETLINKIKTINSEAKFLFTVSPIRHWKDGAHNNQLSKSILLLAIDKLKEIFPDIHYFPSYEIVLDELRDYRFYAKDMLHPNEIAIEYIWERFSDTYHSVETKSIIKQWNNIRQAIEHRPFNAEGNDYKHFLRQTLLKLNDFKSRYPYFECEKDVILLINKLSRSVQ